MPYENQSVVWEGDVFRVKSGGSIIVESGGVLDLKTGAQLRANGVQAAAITNLTMSVGTADNTIADVTASHDQTILNNNFRDLGEKVNAILGVLRGAGLIAP